jgi:putative ABC transport system permease protein
MGLMSSLRAWLGVAVRRDRFEDAMSDELRFHVDAYVEDLVRAGASRASAERRARVELGGLEGLKEELRQARGLRFVDELRQDGRYALRRLRSGRGVAVIAVLTLGVGVNLAVFSVIYTAMLQPLPHPNPERLVAVASRNLANGGDHLTSPLDFFDFERQAAAFERLAAYYPPGFTLTGQGNAERVSGARASSGIFDVFGVQPVVGRGFLPDEDKAGASRVAVISHGLWTRRYQQDPSIIGRPMLLSGSPYTVVGVLPEGFHSPAMWPRMPEVWVPLGVDPNVGRRDARMLRVIGRLRAGATVATARAELEQIARVLVVEHPDSNAGTGAAVVPLLEQLTREVRPSLLMLAAAVAALLLVACGNAAGLLVGGTLERQHEFATRLALGAGRFRIARQILAENLVLGLLAAVAGFGLAVLASGFLVETATAAGVPRASEISVGLTTLLLGVVLSLVCTAVCALVAALATTRSRAARPIGNGARMTAGPQRSRRALIGLEAAFSLALLAGAALLMQSFYQLQTIHPGFEARDALTTRLSPPAARYPAGPVLAAFYDRVIDGVKALPGVETASVVDWLPLSGFGASIGFTLADGATGSDTARRLAELRVIGHDFFRTLRIPVVAGRPFDGRDRDGTLPVVIINQALARAYFGSANPIGRRLTLDRQEPITVEIIGVVGDVREFSLRLAAGPHIYAAKTQLPWMRHEARDLVVRASRDVERLVPAIAAVIRHLEPDLPLGPVQRMEEVVAGSLVRARFYAWAVAIFALTAVLLAAFGIYGAVASAVTQRTREIGVRLALGATRRNVLAHAAGYGAWPTLVGLVVGVPLALVAGQIVRQQLFGVGPTDLWTLSTVAVGMATVALAAALLPAIRAARIDPAVTLRHDAAG